MDRREFVKLEIAEVLADLDLEAPEWRGDTLPLRYGPLVALITVLDHDDTQWVRLTVSMLYEVAPSLALVQRLLRLNDELLTGCFLLFEDNTLAYSQTLPEESLQGPGWRRAALYGLRIAEEQVLELRALGGGVVSGEEL
ncbi:MAG: hypothetical protein JXX28_03035 [Deltaproteobacteria bacterium]|nr:hypothetical protein [Deltaproteobacteria bacterium]